MARLSELLRMMLRAVTRPCWGVNFLLLIFGRTARQIHDQVRGLIPWPAASLELKGQIFKVFAVEETGQTSQERRREAFLGADKKGVNVVCGDGKVLRHRLEWRAPGKKRMRTVDYLRGHQLFD